MEENVVVGTSVLEGTTRTVVQQGLADAGATVTDVVGIAVPVVIAAVLLTAAVNYAIKKVKGVLSKAA